MDKSSTNNQPFLIEDANENSEVEQLYQHINQLTQQVMYLEQ